MEDRSDLSDILFAGLPQQEADHVRAVIRQTDEELLARKRAAVDPIEFDIEMTADTTTAVDERVEDSFAS